MSNSNVGKKFVRVNAEQDRHVAQVDAAVNNLMRRISDGKGKLKPDWETDASAAGLIDDVWKNLANVAVAQRLVLLNEAIGDEAFRSPVTARALWQPLAALPWMEAFYAIVENKMTVDPGHVSALLQKERIGKEDVRALLENNVRPAAQEKKSSKKPTVVAASDGFYE